jgi:hypothetical protein
MMNSAEQCMSPWLASVLFLVEGLYIFRETGVSSYFRGIIIVVIIIIDESYYY